MTHGLRRPVWTPFAVAAVAAVAAVVATSCGGVSSDDAAGTRADSEATQPAADDAAGATTDGEPGIVTFRPVIVCGTEIAPDESLDQEVLPQVGGEEPCVVGPPAGTGDVFERGSAVVEFIESTQQWVVNVDLRAAGEVVWNAVAQQCFSGSSGCPSRQLAFVVDDVIQSAPVVQTPTFPGTVQISGAFSEDDVRALAEVLNRSVEHDEPDQPGDADDENSEDGGDGGADDEAGPVASTPDSTAAPTTTEPDPAGSPGGFAMPEMCGLPAAEWTTNEHPASQDQGIWASGNHDEGDLDGDGTADFAWATVCGQGTVAAERDVQVFDSARRFLGTLPVEATVEQAYPDRTVHALEPRISDEEVGVEVWVWQSSDASCCPSVTFEMSFAWDEGRFVATSSVPDATTAGTSAGTPAGEAPVVDWDGQYRPKTSPGRVVRLGEFGRQVELLQQALDQRGYDVDADGYFGPGTETAVRQFQRDRDLPVTGIATEDVWNQFGE